MAEQANENQDSDVRFTEGEIVALRKIVTDWINEEIVQPPFPPAVASVIEKLGITPPPEEEVDFAPLVDPGEPVPIRGLTAPVPRQLDDPSDPVGAPGA